MSLGEIPELGEQLRLADAGRTLDQEKATTSRGGVLEQLGELRKLLIALEEPRPAARRTGFGNGGQLSSFVAVA